LLAALATITLQLRDLNDRWVLIDRRSETSFSISR
jgi:hypothetical protein